MVSFTGAPPIYIPNKIANPNLPNIHLEINVKLSVVSNSFGLQE